LEFENDVISSPLLINEKCVNVKNKNLDDREIRIIRLLAKTHDETRSELQKILCNSSQQRQAPEPEP
jgi:hypothetical protein